MEKEKIFESIQSWKLIAIVRARSVQEALDVSQALYEGGVRILEVTYTLKETSYVLDTLRARFEGKLLLGAGTVLDAATARHAILAGAQFLISPSLDEEAVRMANRYAVPFIPGVGSIREAQLALSLGCETLKLFPADALGLMGMKAIHKALPFARFIPTGGVSLQNAPDWLSAGAVALGVGGSLTQGDPAQITQGAKRFLQAIQ